MKGTVNNMQLLSNLALSRVSLLALGAMLALSCAAFAQPAAPATAPAAVSPEASAVVTNTMCPVMTSNPINPDIHIDYQGKRVHFCCDGCPATFQANPQQYLGNLPQFGGTEPNAATHDDHSHSAAPSTSGCSGCS